jgi:hypothetical protein
LGKDRLPKSEVAKIESDWKKLAERKKSVLFRRIFAIMNYDG